MNHPTVTLVGGGPGDEQLLTIAAVHAIAEADVILFDRLAPLSILEAARPGCELVEVGKIPRGPFTPQERINELLIEHARAGRRVVRLKGGDPYVFGRGGEEALACAEAGVRMVEVPGISSSIAAAAAAGIPVTHRGLTQGFTVVSGHLPPGHPDCDLDWAALARTGTTLVVMMGVLRLPEVCAALRDGGLVADTPAVCVEKADHPDQRVVRGTLATLPALCVEAGIVAPATTIIGAVAGLELGTAPRPVGRAQRAETPLGTVAHGDRLLPVHRATADDIGPIVGLLTDDILGATREGGDAAAYAQAFRAIDRDPNQVLAVVRDGAEVVATLQLTFIPGLSRGGSMRAQIESVRVAASHRGGGLGAAFLGWAEAYAADRGAVLAQLTTDRLRPDAQRFYTRAGWTAGHVGMKKPLGA